jgi:hypothetical protein
MEGSTMKSSLGLSTVGIIACSGLLTGCSMAEPEDDVADVEAFGTLEQPLCENKGGTNAVMTAIAVAAGKELRRWSPENDFQWNNATGMLQLSATGIARCPNRACVNTQALLDMQKPEAHGKVKFPGNITLDSNLLKQQLKSGWNSQMSCNSSGACAAPSHDLRFAYVEAGSCDKKFFFDPLKGGTSTRLGLTDADKLKNKLKFVGYPTNKMLNFYIRDGQVSVDPTYGLNEGTSTTLASCDAACTKFSQSNIASRCCSCNGATRRFVKSAWNAATFLCSG